MQFTCRTERKETKLSSLNYYCKDYNEEKDPAFEKKSYDHLDLKYKVYTVEMQNKPKWKVRYKS